MHRIRLLSSVVLLVALRAPAQDAVPRAIDGQETPAQNLVRLWLDDPRPEIERRVLELGTEAIAPLLARLGIETASETAETRAETTLDPVVERRILAVLARLQQAAASAFSPLATAARNKEPGEKAAYYEALAALAPWRRREDALWSSRFDHAAARMLAPHFAGKSWPSDIPLVVQRAAARCWGHPATSLEDQALRLDGLSPWRVELALEALAREAATRPDAVRNHRPKLIAIARRPDPRVLFTTKFFGLRASAARLALALDPEGEDAKALRGALLGEPPVSKTTADLPPETAARIRECIAGLAADSTRTEARANLEAFGEIALPALAASLDARTDEVVAREVLRLLRASAPRAAPVMPALLDALADAPLPLRAPLLHTIACIAPWSLDRVPWFRVDGRRQYFVEGQLLAVNGEDANLEAMRHLAHASEADANCSLDELRDLLTSDNPLVREVGATIAAHRPADARLLSNELLACLDPERMPPPAPRGVVFLAAAESAGNARHLERIAELALRTAAPDSPLGRLATKTLANAAETDGDRPPEQTKTVEVATATTAGATPSAEPSPNEAPAPSPRELELRELVAHLDSRDRETARRHLAAAGPDGARALADGLGEDESTTRTIERLALLTRLGPAAGPQFDAIQRAACRRPLRCPVEFAATLAELAPHRPERSRLVSDLPLRVSSKDDLADLQATNQALALVAVRLRARTLVRATDDVPALVARLASRRAFVVEAAIECLAARGNAAASAIPTLRALTRQSDPRILRADQTVQLQAKAAAAILAIDPYVPFADELRRPVERPTRRLPPERALARANELLRELDDVERRTAARENLILLGPLCAPAVAEFAVANSHSAAGLAAVDVLLEGSCDTTAATASLVEALAVAPPADRLRLLMLLAFVAPWSRDVLVPPRRDTFSQLRLDEVDLMQGLHPRSRSAIRVVAEDVEQGLAFDPEAPADEVAKQLEADSFPVRLHAMLAIRMRPGAFQEAATRLGREMEGSASYTRFGVFLDPPSVDFLTKRYRRAAAEALLAQVAPDSLEAERARAVLDGLWGVKGK